ncbi:MAG: hypothetical protein IIY16_00355, partial [Oscillospiraceae bacterium]|nr:hypothetical protein [Oscillospiraceae bacterium]
TIEQQNGEVLGIEALDVAHALSGMFTKKQEILAPQGSHSDESTTDDAHKISYDVSIKDLLDIVKMTHEEILSDDVIETLDIERTKNPIRSFFRNSA